MWELKLLNDPLLLLYSERDLCCHCPLEDLDREGAHDLLDVGDLLNQGANNIHSPWRCGWYGFGPVSWGRCPSSRVEIKRLVCRVVLGDGSNRRGLGPVLLLLLLLTLGALLRKKAEISAVTSRLFT